MGILRVDKLSGLETPTAVTGSVVFDGTGDALTITSNDITMNNADYTAEGWFYYNALPSSSAYRLLGTVNVAGDTTEWQLIHATNGTLTLWNGSAYTSTGTSPILINNWTHLAVVRSSNVQTLYVNGKAQPTTVAYSANLTHNVFDIGGRTDGAESFNGYISNVRLLKGTALYTSDFTVPTHELEVIGDTVLLCCNNPDSAGAEATGKTISIVGNAAASTFSPGLTRDFTSGTEFNGVTTFDTQGYFVPPSGTTEQRNLCGTRGLFGGSNPTPADGSGNAIEFITVSTTGNSQDFGDRIGKGRRQIAAMADRTRGVFGGSYGPSSTMGDTIDFVTIASTGNAVDFGDCLNDLTEATGISNNTRGIMAGGRTPTVHDVMQYVTIKSLGNAIDFGNLLVAKRNCGSFQSPTRGVVVGGRNSGGTSLKVIEYVEISTLGNSVDFGDLSTAGGEVNMGGSNSVRGIIGGGNPSTNAIEYVTISTTGNSQDFGDNTAAARGLNTMATSPTRACMYGAVAPARDLSYVEIATTGDAQDFGNLSIDPTSNYHAGTSNGHGGLS